MAKEKQNVTMHFDAWQDMRLLSNEECGKVMFAVFDYAESGIEPLFAERHLEMAFNNFKRSIDIFEKAYLARCEKNRNNVTKRWNKNKSATTVCNGKTSVAGEIKKSEDTNVFDGKFRNTNYTYTDTETDTDTDTETDTETYTDTKLKEKNILTDIPKEKSPKSKSKSKKKKFGEFQNVLLSDEEMEKLKAFFPHDLDDRITRLDEYIENSGRKYKNHYLTIKTWARKDGYDFEAVQKTEEKASQPMESITIEQLNAMWRGES